MRTIFSVSGLRSPIEVNLNLVGNSTPFDNPFAWVVSLDLVLFGSPSSSSSLVKTTLDKPAWAAWSIGLVTYSPVAQTPPP